MKIGRPTIWALRAALLILLVGGWELASGRVFEEFFVSKPSAIIAVAWGWVLSGRLFYHAGITITEAVAGFALGGMAGMLTGILLGRLQLLADVLDPSSPCSTACPRSRSRPCSCCGSASAWT